jgi:hypothetical protein
MYRNYWRASDRRRCERLRVFHDSFKARSADVREYVDTMIASGAWRRPPVRSQRQTDDQFDVEREAEQQGISVAQYLRRNW